MRLVFCFLLTSLSVNAFTLTPSHQTTPRVSSALFAETEALPTKTKTLGLLTFDLDDTLYPISKVLNEANAAFARAMNTYGYEGIQPQDIVEACKQIREEMSKEDPQAAAVLTHTEIRRLAIRREMEKVIFHRKLQDTADDWATSVTSLSPVVVSHAKKYVLLKVMNFPYLF